MHDRQKPKGPAPIGTCCAQLISNEVQYGPREYIYNLIAQPSSQFNAQKILPKIRKEVSKLSGEVPKEPRKTMGPPTHPHVKYPEHPEKFLFVKKHWRTPFIERYCMHEKVLIKNREFEKLKVEQPTGRIKGGCCPGFKPPVPTNELLAEQNDGDGIPGRCKKGLDINRTNWIERNAIKVITCKPGFRQPNPNRRVQVDTRHGNKMALEETKTHSGLEKRFVYKPTYGKVPHYLKERAAAIQATRALYSRYLNEKCLQTTDYLLTNEERGEIICGLKAAWDRYNACYLRLSSSSTTLKSKAYKKFLETQLDDLEKDLDTIQGHPYIFIDAEKGLGIGTSVTKDIHA